MSKHHLEVRYSLGLTGSRLPRLEQVSEILAEAIGPESSPFVEADWKVVTDPRGRELYRLSIVDPHGGPVSTDFTPEELEIPLHMYVRLYRLWGDLLKIRSDKQHEKVRELFEQLATD